MDRAKKAAEEIAQRWTEIIAAANNEPDPCRPNRAAIALTAEIIRSYFPVEEDGLLEAAKAIDSKLKEMGIGQKSPEVRRLRTEIAKRE